MKVMILLRNQHENLQTIQKLQSKKESVGDLERKWGNKKNWKKAKRQIKSTNLLLPYNKCKKRFSNTTNNNKTKQTVNSRMYGKDWRLKLS